MALRPTLVIFVKEPRPGRVKTRLGAGIGLVPAAWWFRHQSRSLLRRIRDRKWDIVLSVSPDTSVSGREWPQNLPRMAQGTGDIGQRMSRAFQNLGRGPIVLIGGDIPGVNPLHIQKAFEELKRSDIVFGPANDGGFWLVGMRQVRCPQNLFQNVRWSTEFALSDTLANIPEAKVGFVDTMSDVDTAADLLQ